MAPPTPRQARLSYGRGIERQLRKRGRLEKAAVTEILDIVADLRKSVIDRLAVSGGGGD